MLASTMWFPMDGRDQPHARLAGVSVGPPTTHRTCYGGHSERETPGHIPNPEAKTLSADGTAGETPWESRTPPDNSQTRPSSHPKMASSHSCTLLCHFLWGARQARPVGRPRPWGRG